MADPKPVDDPIKQLTAIVWYDAATIRALLLAAVGLIGAIAGVFGINEALFTDKAAHIVDQLSTLLTLGGVVWAAVSRAGKPTPQITLTQGSADQVNSSLPAKLAQASATVPETKS